MNVRDFLLGAACAAVIVSVLRGPDRVVAADSGPSQPPPYVLESATGKYGGPLLFVLDTKSKVLSVYEAEGGTPATRGLTWIASRKIEFDSYTTMYNDKSETSYSALKQRFEDEFSKRAAGAATEASDGNH
jgi:hypothetical protein